MRLEEQAYLVLVFAQPLNLMQAQHYFKIFDYVKHLHEQKFTP